MEEIDDVEIYILFREMCLSMNFGFVIIAKIVKVVLEFSQF